MLLKSVLYSLSDSSTLSETHIYLIFLFPYMNPIFFLPHPWHPQSIDHAVLSHIYWHGTVSILTSSFPAALTIWWIFQLSLASWFIVSHTSLSRNELRSMLVSYKYFWHSVIPFIKCQYNFSIFLSFCLPVLDLLHSYSWVVLIRHTFSFDFWSQKQLSFSFSCTFPPFVDIHWNNFFFLFLMFEHETLHSAIVQYSYCPRLLSSISPWQDSLFWKPI